MPGFRHTLIVVWPLCDADCAVTFTREAVIVRDKQGTALLTGWREATGPRLWRIALQPGYSNLPSMPNDVKQATLAAYSTYDLPSVAALIRYFHTAAGCQSSLHGLNPSARETTNRGQVSLSPTQTNIALPPRQPSWDTLSKNARA